MTYTTLTLLIKMHAMNKNPNDTERCKIKAKFTKNARTAWGIIISTASIKERKKILLPSYIGYTEREGSGVFDPVENNNCDYAFYKIDNDLSPNLEDLGRKLSADIDILLIIHYFGFCRTDLCLIKEMCFNNNVVMVEDCAHAFYLSENPLKIGEIGDYSFYSIHKYLPTQTGGLLRVNSNNISSPAIDDIDCAETKVVTQYALSEFSLIASIRRDHYKSYSSQLRGVKGLIQLYELNEFDIPQSFPLIVENGLREKLYFHLLDLQLPTTALYYRLIEQIRFTEFPDSHYIAKSILNLPVHQDVAAEEVNSMCTEIVKFLEISRTVAIKNSTNAV